MHLLVKRTVQPTQSRRWLWHWRFASTTIRFHTFSCAYLCGALKGHGQTHLLWKHVRYMPIGSFTKGEYVNPTTFWKEMDGLTRGPWDSTRIVDGSRLLIHPKLRNIYPHNVTHSLISQNPRDPKERMFIVQISLLIVTFLSLISRILSLMQTIKEVNPHPRIAPCANMWSVTFFLFFSSSSSATCWILVHAYATLPGKSSGVDHTTPFNILHFVLFHSVTS